MTLRAAEETFPTQQGRSPHSISKVESPFESVDDEEDVFTEVVDLSPWLVLFADWKSLHVWVGTRTR